MLGDVCEWCVNVCECVDGDVNDWGCDGGMWDVRCVDKCEMMRCDDGDARGWGVEFGFDEWDWGGGNDWGSDVVVVG